MSNAHTNARVTNPDGGELSVSHTTTDSPILPAANLKQLQEIDPSLVPWVVKQTETEANHRRAQTQRINTFVFIERIAGVIIGGFVAIAGLGISAYVAIQGHDVTASIIGGTTLVGMVVAIVTKKGGANNQKPPPQQKTFPKRKR